MALGLAVSLASLVPVLNLLLMPVFVVAGTLIHLEATAAETARTSPPERPAEP